MKRLSRHLSPLLSGSAIALICLAFSVFVVEWSAGRLRKERERELLIHSQKLVTGLKAQLFERYADSQALAMNAYLEKALLEGGTDARARASQTLNHFVQLYQVYPLVVLTDLTGKVVAVNDQLSDGRPIALSGWRTFQGTPGRIWRENPDAPRTRIEEFHLDPAAAAVLGREFLQAFSSPVVDRRGKVIGAVTNYTNGLYLEREFLQADADFAAIGIPSAEIELINGKGQVFARFDHDGSRYFPVGLGSAAGLVAGAVVSEGDRVATVLPLVETRYPNPVDWSLALRTDERHLFLDVYRLRRASYLVAGLFSMAIFLAAFAFYRLQKKYDQGLRQSLIEAQETERSRVARDIHDQLGQTLTALKIQISRMDLVPPEKRAEYQQEAQLMIAEATRTLRRVSHELHSSILDHLGLPEALSWKIEQMNSEKGPVNQFRADRDVKFTQIPKDAQTHLFRVAMEAINNAHRHSGASRIDVALFQESNSIVLDVSDNGKGFIPEAAKSSFGLKGMKERAEYCGGRLSIRSNPGEGTSVRCRIPFGNQKQARMET